MSGLQTHTGVWRRGCKHFISPPGCTEVESKCCVPSHVPLLFSAWALKLWAVRHNMSHTTVRIRQYKRQEESDVEVESSKAAVICRPTSWLNSSIYSLQWANVALRTSNVLDQWSSYKEPNGRSSKETTEPLIYCTLDLHGKGLFPVFIAKR